MIRVVYTDGTLDLFKKESDFHQTVGYRLKHGLSGVKTVDFT